MSDSDKIIDFDIERKKELISKIRECDSLHNNCDYLLGHNECDDIVEYFDQLQQENKELKEQNENLKKYYEYDNKSWKNLAIKQAHDLEIKNNILIDFEKWLEEEINNRKIYYEDPLSKIPMTIIDTLKFCLDKLQELKEGKK